MMNYGNGINYIDKSILHVNSEIQYINDAVDETENKLKQNVSVDATTTVTQYIDSLATGKQSRIKPVTDKDLKSEATYTTTMGWYSTSDADYRNRIFNYEKLSEGILPRLTMASSKRYNTTAKAPATNPTVIESMKIMFPGRETEYEITIPNTNSSSTGGSGGGAGLNLDGAPKALIYASGIDTVNIDFDHIDEIYTYEISIGGNVSTGTVNTRTLSFDYDYRSDITLVVRGEGNEIIYTKSPSQLARNVMVSGNAYHYLTSEAIVSGTGSSGLPNKYGEYIHLFDGKALGKDGSVTDLATGTIVSATDRGFALGQAKTAVPVATGMYAGYNIETYALYSVTTNAEGETSVKDNFLFYTDGNTLQSLKTSGDIVSSSVVLDGSNGEVYFAALGADRRLNVLLDGAFKVPEEISREGIFEMSNSFNSNVPYCAVRYSNGGLCVFNYITGEILLDLQAEKGTARGGGDAASDSTALSFARADKLNEALTSGAYDLESLLGLTSPLSNGVGVEGVNEAESLNGYGEANSEEGNLPVGNLSASGSSLAEGLVGGITTGEGLVNGTGVVGEDISENTDKDNKSQAEAPAQSEEDVRVGSSSESGATALIGTATGSTDGNTQSGEGFGNGEAVQNVTTDAGAKVEGKPDGNTISGTSALPGTADVDGQVTTPREGDPNTLTGTVETTAGTTETVSGSIENALIEYAASSGSSLDELIIETETGSNVTLLGLARDADTRLADVPDEIVIKTVKDVLYDIRDKAQQQYEQRLAQEYAQEKKAVSELSTQELMDAYLEQLESVTESQKFEFVPVFDAQTGEYSLYEVGELLGGGSQMMRSVEERLEEKGKFIDTGLSYRSSSDNATSVHNYKGFMAVVIAVILAGALTIAMIYKKRKEEGR